MMNRLGTRAITICRIGALFTAVSGAMLSGCPPGSTSTCECIDTTYNPIINPADFGGKIDNPFLPLKPGTTLVYEGETDEGMERIEYAVTHKTKEILGVTCVVVHDQVTLEGELIEDTYDWFAQDKQGSVWYFGEASMEWEDGMVVSTFGSWEAGVDCAKPGIVMKAEPKVGDNYRQEFYPCIAEDEATVLALDETITVPQGTHQNCLRTHDFTQLDSEVNEEKVYARGIGVVAEFDDGELAEALISISTGNED
jgi:hypothetical protein